MKLRDLIAETTAALKSAGIDNPRLDARVLIGHVLNTDPAQTFLRNDTELTPDQSARLAALIQRRLNNEPVSRIVGNREFWGLTFKVTPDVLDPRPDTETLVAAMLDRRKPTPRILDLGTGSGCIILSLLHAMPDATGVAVDASQAALDVARANAFALQLDMRVSFVRGSWTDALQGPFDVIVSNPPYLNAHDMAHLEPEVRFDPALALDGGPDGLDAYRIILADVRRIAAPSCWVALEVGWGQANAVAELAEQHALRVAEIRADLAGIPRVVIAQI